LLPLFEEEEEEEEEGERTWPQFKGSRVSLWVACSSLLESDRMEEREREREKEREREPQGELEKKES